MFEKTKNYFRGVRQELKAVNWPTTREAIRLTTIVIVISLILAAFLGAFDGLFRYLLSLIV